MFENSEQSRQSRVESAALPPPEPALRASGIEECLGAETVRTSVRAGMLAQPWRLHTGREHRRRPLVPRADRGRPRVSQMHCGSVAAALVAAPSVGAGSPNHQPPPALRDAGHSNRNARWSRQRVPRRSLQAKPGLAGWAGDFPGSRQRSVLHRCSSPSRTAAPTVVGASLPRPRWHRPSRDSSAPLGAPVRAGMPARP